MLDKININHIIDIAQEAGRAIMEVYIRNFEVTEKEDRSPLTEADELSNQIILKKLQQLYPAIPYISEEIKQLPYSARKNWEYCWLIDPLDGTKEFIKKNGEFTVNIALVHNGEPVLGVIDVPAKSETYYSIRGKGSFKLDDSGRKKTLRVREEADPEKLVMAGSRSHKSERMETYIKQKQQEFPYVDFISAGSSLKFCMVAEGIADEYPRLGPTMEWDTCAGHAIVLEAGGSVNIFDSGEPLKYNKEDLRNPFFLVRK